MIKVMRGNIMRNFPKKFHLSCLAGFWIRLWFFIKNLWRIQVFVKPNPLLRLYLLKWNYIIDVFKAYSSRDIDAWRLTINLFVSPQESTASTKERIWIFWGIYELFPAVANISCIWKLNNSRISQTFSNLSVK